MIAALASMFAALAPAIGPGPMDRSPRRAVCAEWPLWDAYRTRFVSTDGRVIDHDAAGRTTSEGQAYALFFALVAGDRATFAELLRWTEDNLAQGALAEHLPAWSWGRDREGRWRVLDANSASDADLWLAYTLLEAGRLFDEPRWHDLGRRVLANVAKHEVAELPGLGRTLLPGPHGFVLAEKQRWRLNPSYLPTQVLRRLATLDPAGPWTELLASTLRLLDGAAPERFAPDWVTYDAERGFVADSVSGYTGSYDAIRNYLWASLLADDAPERPRLRERLRGYYQLWRANGVVAERVDVRSPGAEDLRAGPPGFSAVALSWARAFGERGDAEKLAAELEATKRGELYGHPPSYYDQNLALFALGHLEGRFRFDAGGELHRGAPAASAPRDRRDQP